MEVDNKKNMEEKRNGWVEKGLTEEQGWGVAITGKGLFPMFMATNFHFNAEFPSFPSFFFSSSFSFLPLVSFFFSLIPVNPFLVERSVEKKKEKKKEGHYGAPFERANGLSCYKPGFPEVPFTPFAFYTLFRR